VEHTNIIDLGGNIGTTTLLMSEVLSKDCKVFTFEPIYSDILLQNVIENKLTDCVTVYPYGVGNKIETLKITPIHLLEPINFGAVSIIRTLENNDNSLPIKIVPLDYFHFEKVSLLKIDVEHMEIQVLEGCIDLIRRCKPTILIETYQLQEVAQTNVFKEIMSLGYEISIMPEGCNDYIMKIKTA
jgi:FkbM family methyltransferase